MARYPFSRHYAQTSPPSPTLVSMSPYEWSVIDSASRLGRTYSRVLGPTEERFFYDRIFNGTADIVWSYTVQGTNTVQDVAVFSEANVSRAWATLKQLHPLLGARMEVNSEDRTVAFVVAEQALLTHQQDEVTVRTVSSVAEVEATIWHYARDAPTEDHHIMARVWVFARGDEPGTYEVLFRAAHAISDGISGATLARTFFDILSSPPTKIPSLEERLALVVPSNALNPTLEMSSARQRWRRAIAKVTFFNRRGKLAGGHTFPRTITDSTYCTPARTERPSTEFTISESRAILDSCRRYKVTFGAAVPVISQMALTRFLHRRYLRGDISLEEWEYRRRQPMHYGGPLNLRSYLDREWQRKGGPMSVALMIDFYDVTLPFMPTPYGSRRDESLPRAADGAPPYAALLSRDRVVYRTKLARRQLANSVKHPLLLEIAHARQPLYVVRQKMITAHYNATRKGEPLPSFPELADFDKVPSDYVFTGGMSSVGDMSILLPSNYPLPTSHPLSIQAYTAPSSNSGNASEAPAGSKVSKTPPPVTAAEDAVLRILDSSTVLHSRPMEFFLGNWTSRDRIHLTLTYDGNVYRKEDVEEYLQDCREAALYYFAEDENARVKL
ncbi:hypothetical protein C8Q78DRAFT_1035959 [Trametes maxima]|nr:hypothetical protein C8Q78DRAFT_1035959 [Trametes maxima]